MANGFFLSAFLCCFCLHTARAQAPAVYSSNGDDTPTQDVITKHGTQVFSFSSGYVVTFKPNRGHPTVVKGIPFSASWEYVGTDTVGKGIGAGQIFLGGEILFVEYIAPVTTYGIGLSPTIKYSLRPYERWRPFFNIGAGIFWTDLGGRIPEKGARFNFILQAGTGVDLYVTSRHSVNVGLRYQHVSNGGTASPNVGIDSFHPYIGGSYVF